MTIVLTDADRSQLLASDPTVSAFVDASAGSGKTKLLTDRILRLMMAGYDPREIHCLTFTKAAAAEMALRLRAVLAAWVMAKEDDLKVALLRLAIEPNTKNLAFARSLFGAVLDLPGGVNIGTIHSFCQSMLRRFPLEARVSPHFKIEDEASAALRRRKAKDQVVGDDSAAGAVEVLAGEQNDEQFTDALTSLLADPEELISSINAYGVEGVIERQRIALGLAGITEDDIWAEAVSPDEHALDASLSLVREAGSASAVKIAAPGLEWLKLPAPRRRAAFEAWKGVFLTQGGTPRDGKGLANKALLEAHPNVLDAIREEQARLCLIVEKLKACGLAAASAALVSLVAPILAAEEKIKAATDMLDYPDLIVKTAGLLVDPGATWVLYKMDGGISHILLDEVQDVSPAQQRIIGALVNDFFDGEGAHSRERTIFAVGDVKQSIFSFQGADLNSFAAWYEELRAKVLGAGKKWVNGELNTSFRSSAGVLDVVDAVFEDDAARRGVALDEATIIKHKVSRAGQAGSVSLWPLVPKIENPEVPEWAVPEQYHMGLTARRRLARGLAAWLSRAIGNFELQSRGRTLRAGDVLVLVRSRNEFGEALVPALKEAGIPVAGLDRITLADSRAVADLIAFAEAVTLPQNDLAMATFLASPLGGLSDESLMELALGRDGTLTGALFARGNEREEWQGALNLYTQMQALADFVKPYEFFAELLGKHNGRSIMARRLGPDALEPMDEFLAAAQRYSITHTPNLRGFLYSVETSAAEIKRETDVSADAVRIMTVHGAKGLQAPVVIMPDTTSQPGVKEKLFWLGGEFGHPAVPVLCPRESKRTVAIEREIERMKEEEIAEHNRLLYVALTRAEDHLIVCGSATDGVAPENSWYASIERGLKSLPATKSSEALGLDWGDSGLIYAVEQESAPDQVRRTAAVAELVTLPVWVGAGPDYTPAPPPADPDPIDRIVPSRVGEDEATNIRAGRPFFGAGRGREAAKRRGTLVHALLQYMPVSASDEAPVLAGEYLQANGVPDDEIDVLVDEALRIMQRPEIAAVFGPSSQAEVPIVGVIDAKEISGIVDRMHVSRDVVTIVDFKSDRRPPDDAKDMPAAYIKQVDAYKSVLRVAYPGRAVRAFIAWTASGEVMEVV